MAPLKDIARVVNGLSLVAKEAIARGSADTLIKGALLSATDAAGLTKGNLRSLDTPRTHIHNNNNNDNKNHGDTGGSSSIVYFDNRNRNNDDDADTLPTPVADAAVALPAPSTSNPDSHSQTAFDAPSTSASAPSAVIDVDGNHRRKPRERRVPSTPFSRAVG